MTVIARIAKRKTSTALSTKASSGSILDNFVDSKKILEEKFQALTNKKLASERKMRITQDRISRWERLIGEATYGREHLSEKANLAIDKLVSQAENYLRNTEKELEMHQTVLNSIREQLSSIEEMLVRLKNSEYEIHLHNTFKGLKKDTVEELSAQENLTLNLQEIERDVKRLEYTSEALLEIGA